MENVKLYLLRHKQVYKLPAKYICPLLAMLDTVMDRNSYDTIVITLKCHTGSNLLLFSLSFINPFTSSTQSSHPFVFLAGGNMSGPFGQCHDGFFWSHICVLFQKGSAVRTSECPAVACLGPCQIQLLHHQRTGLTSPDCTLLCFRDMVISHLPTLL